MKCCDAKCDIRADSAQSQKSVGELKALLREAVKIMELRRIDVDTRWLDELRNACG